MVGRHGGHAGKEEGEKDDLDPPFDDVFVMYTPPKLYNGVPLKGAAGSVSSSFRWQAETGAEPLVEVKSALLNGWY